MNSAGPTPLRYFNSPKERLDFRRPKRKPVRVWPFFLVVAVMAAAVVGLLRFMDGTDGVPTAGVMTIAPPDSVDG